MVYTTLESLTEKDIYHGISCIIIVIISTIIGIRILLAYLKYRQKEHITVGLTYVFLLSPYWGGAISFFTVLLANYALDPQLYIFITSAFLPIALISWIYSVSNLIYKNKKRLIIGIFAAIVVVFEIFLMIFLFTEYTIIGEMRGPINSMSNDFLLIFQLFTIASMEITGLHFAIGSIKSNTPTVKLRGYFLLIGWLVILIASLIDAILFFTPLMMLIIRLLLISGTIFWYFGFFLSEKMVNKISK
ncbi:MAG: hypothetical protein GF317_18320 [Candidatus Lokiarchaeota archaeon]|nr:hypothetical protein [Candidatus Lokiarchaeota archaeon]MBD3201471.1 hypothetical protein [Candidatus Lokiarchaeota archaeon]